MKRCFILPSFTTMDYERSRILLLHVPHYGTCLTATPHFCTFSMMTVAVVPRLVATSTSLWVTSGAHNTSLRPGPSLHTGSCRARTAPRTQVSDEGVNVNRTTE